MREAFIRLFGEEKAPRVPTNKASLSLPMQQRMAVEQAHPDSTKPLQPVLNSSLRPYPCVIPGELTVKDIPALMKVGMPATCRKVQNAARDAAMQKMAAEMEERPVA